MTLSHGSSGRDNARVFSGVSDDRYPTNSMMPTGTSLIRYDTALQTGQSSMRALDREVV